MTALGTGQWRRFEGALPACEAEPAAQPPLDFVMVELLFPPSVYAPFPTCHGTRYKAKTLEIRCRGKTIADGTAS